MRPPQLEERTRETAARRSRLASTISKSGDSIFAASRASSFERTPTRSCCSVTVTEKLIHPSMVSTPSRGGGGGGGAYRCFFFFETGGGGGGGGAAPGCEESTPPKRMSAYAETGEQSRT